MKLKDFNYNLPKNLIAQRPIFPRDHSRLMVLNRAEKTIIHRHFYDILDYLQKGDVLVLNNTKVFPARLIGKRKDTGGKIEIFLLKDLGQGKWKTLIGNRRKKIGQIIKFGPSTSLGAVLQCKIVKQIDKSVWQVKFNKSGKALEKLIEKLGQAPTPPYIKNATAKAELKKEYQTVFAKYKGSVAAPTAGFHFTKKLLAQLKDKGVQIEYVTLHVGLGTFQAVKEQDISHHKMPAEWARINKKTADKLNNAKQAGGRIIAVGTTTVRTLESFVKNNKLKAGNHWTNIFIYPGYKFKFIDSLITNFHLPKSTLIMLISAFAGRNFILKAYGRAIRKQYRFYSFGDAMFIV